MSAYAVEYEFGTARHVALKMPECLYYAGQLKSTPVAVSVAKARLLDLDARLDTCGHKLKTSQVIPFPADVPPLPDDLHRRVEPKDPYLRKLAGLPKEPKPFTLAEPSTSSQSAQPTADGFEYVLQNSRSVRKAQSQQNILEALRLLHRQLTYNEFIQQTLVVHSDMTSRRQYTNPLDDINEAGMWLAMDKQFEFLPPREYFRAVLINESHKHSYHPICEYLDGLKWDGAPRIHHWLVLLAGAVDTEYVRKVSAIVLIAAVRRARQPGAKYDEIVVLEGAQGIEKSNGLQALCHDPDWFTDSLPLNASPKEVIEQTAGRWLVEVAELSGISGAKVEQLKAMLSRQTDSSRMAYGHHRVDRRRQWVAFGTTNDSEYLRDDTGNRRFWPVKVEKFDVAGIIAQRDQLWAEAAQREASGESIRLPESLWSDAASEQEQRHVTDPWEDELKHNLATQTWPKGLKRVSRRDLYGWLGKNIAHASKTDNMRLKAIMNRLGWKALTVVVNGKHEAGYGCDT